MSQQSIDPPDAASSPGSSSGFSSGSSSGFPAGFPSATVPAADGAQAPADQPTTADLLEQLRQDRLWLLRQLDSGRWSEWRLDLAALERELGQLLDQIEERRGVS